MKVEPDEHLISAGECFMFLAWVESAMRDLVVLESGGEDMRRRYNKAFGQDSHPSDFSQKRLELGKCTFGQLKNKFLEIWPQQREIREAIERIVIWRNGFGHANVQPFRKYLLYTPDERAWQKINEYMKCDVCYDYMKNCQCSDSELAEPRTLIFRCFDSGFLNSFYGDIKLVDIGCLTPTARYLSVEYRGVAWPVHGGYIAGENRPICEKQI